MLGGIPATKKLPQVQGRYPPRPPKFNEFAPEKLPSQ